MISRHLLAALCATLLLVAGAPAQADAGHDHGDAPAVPTGSALPRFTAVSDTFELVGVLDGKLLTLYLDRFADNSPVPKATLELEIGGTTVKAEPHGEGLFEVQLADAPAPGVLPVTATVIAGSETDLLAGELDIHADAHEDAAAQRNWRRIVGGALGGAVVLALLFALARRARTPQAGGAA
ncbi:hypothetical protein [Variovorax arabinosiphilus]|uniref:hypothetical protein n=1 Tax=Variovorax arabinosiphilus TaxID=3053498 RepID=UPI002577F357|nr:MULTISPECIES: hypothetical protein [unclassified Variovorax]MDM0121881.1 hypothetical protein [Variovorax sp. J2L1-78]MDM0131589.1 hypothetical protein [Variovorax sp. J2L1-63]MDM0234644.1 hypothetical protein [Variovorax sp. J2R1-6]